MLSIKENHILNKFAKVYEMNVRNGVADLNNKDCFFYDDIYCPDKLIIIFLKELDSNELSHLLYLSIISADFHCDLEFLDNLRTISASSLSDLPIEVITDIVKKGIKFLIIKKHNKMNAHKQNNVINDNIDILKKFNYSRIYVQSNFFRHLVYIVVSKYDKDNLDYRTVVREILTTNKYDADLINLSNGLLENEEDLSEFKHTLLKIILFDNYVIEEYYLSEKLESLKAEFGEYLVGTIKGFNTVINHIESCALNNNYSLSSFEPNMLDHLINNFFYFYLEIDDKEEKIATVEKNNKKILTLLNPFYQLDDYE